MSRENQELHAAIARTQARMRELESLIGILAVRHGQSVGLGTHQIRIGSDEAFALRAQLPARDLAVMVTFDAVTGDMVITCI